MAGPWTEVFEGLPEFIAAPLARDVVVAMSVGESSWCEAILGLPVLPTEAARAALDTALSRRVWLGAWVGGVAVVGLGIFRRYCEYRKGKEAVRAACEGRPEGEGAFDRHHKLDRTVILDGVVAPRIPAGRLDGVSWLMEKDGRLHVLRNGTEIVYDPIRPICGKVWLDGTVWNVKYTRQSDLTVGLEMTPVQHPSWRLRLLYWFIRKPAPSAPLSTHRYSEMVRGNWAIFTEKEPGREEVTAYARLGDDSSVEMTSNENLAVTHTLRVAGTNKVSPYQVGTTLNAIDQAKWGNRTTRAGATIASYWQDEKEKERSAVVYKMTDKPVRPDQTLQFLDDSRDDPSSDNRPTGILISAPFTAHPDTAPMMGRQNDLVAVAERLDKVRNLVQLLQQPYRRYSDEFIDLVANHPIVPMSLDELIEHQDGPLQKVRNELARPFVLRLVGRFKVKAMLKKEAITDSGAVRNISTLSPEENLKLGRFAMSVSKYLMRTTTWYGPGKSPAQLAKRVAEICHGRPRVCCSDFSKMDATKNSALAAYLIAGLYCTIMPFDIKEIAELLEAEMLATAVTSTGIPYCAAGTQLSGSATTTNHNTIANAFISYAAFRENGMDKDTAYMNLGTYVGDDGVSLNDATVERVAADLGYVVKAEFVQRGQPVPYLSRWFPDAFEGGDGSLQDVERLMRKAHISFGDPSEGVPQNAINRWRGLCELDPNSGVYASGHVALMRITGLHAKKIDLNWLLSEEKKAGGSGGWPQLADYDSWFSHFTGVQPDAWVKWFAGLKTWDDWMRGPPIIIDRVGKQKVPGVNPANAFAQPVPQSQNVPPLNATTGGANPQTAAAVVLKVKTAAQLLATARRNARRKAARLAAAAGVQNPPQAAPAGNP